MRRKHVENTPQTIRHPIRPPESMGKQGTGTGGLCHLGQVGTGAGHAPGLRVSVRVLLLAGWLQGADGGTLEQRRGSGPGDILPEKGRT